MDVVSRIEAFLAATLDVVASGRLPVFRFVTHSAPPFKATAPTDEATRFAVGDGWEGVDDDFEERSIDTTLNNNHCWQRTAASVPSTPAIESVVERDLVSRNGASAYHLARVFRVLDVVHELLLHSKRSTQRELYYRLHAPPVFNSVQDVADAVHDVCCLLEVPRAALNICCSPKGAVSGYLFIKDPYQSSWQDCASMGLAGWSIPGDAYEIDQLQFNCLAQYVIIIEKDAIFQRLTEDRFFDLIPSVLVTGKGMPDIATRLFLQKLTQMCPHLMVMGLVDWNPSGVAILNIYRNGSPKMGPQAHQVCLPQLEWLGIRGYMVQSLLHQSLTSRDLSLIQTLKSQLHSLPDWIHELDLMLQSGKKCDIEAVYQLTGVHRFAQMLAELLTGVISDTSQSMV